MGRKRKKKNKKKRRFKIPKDRRIKRSVRSYVRKRDTNKCVYCGRRNNSLRLDGIKVKRVKLEYGHVIPHRDNGSRCKDNIQMECKRCNRKKGANIKDIGLLSKILGRGAKGCKKCK